MRSWIRIFALQPSSFALQKNPRRLIATAFGSPLQGDDAIVPADRNRPLKPPRVNCLSRHRHRIHIPPAASNSQITTFPFAHRASFEAPASPAHRPTTWYSPFPPPAHEPRPPVAQPDETLSHEVNIKRPCPLSTNELRLEVESRGKQLPPPPDRNLSTVRICWLLERPQLDPVPIPAHIPLPFNAKSVRRAWHPPFRGRAGVARHPRNSFLVPRIFQSVSSRMRLST